MTRGPRLVACAVAAAVLAVVGCDQALAPGSLAPDFVVQTIGGKVTKLSNYRGRPVVVNLWATWCPPCLEEMPALSELQDRFRERGLVVLGVAGDDKTSSVMKFLEKNPVSFEVLLDPKGAVGTLYGITGYPETFLIDREGRMVGKIVGPLPVDGGKARADVVARIESLIGG